MAFVTGAGIPQALRNTSTRLMIHAVDWYATILRVGSNKSHVAAALLAAAKGSSGGGGAGGSAAAGAMDSLDVWDAVSTGAPASASPRKSFVYNIDSTGESKTSYVSAAVRYGQYKYVVGVNWGTCDPCPAGGKCDVTLQPFPVCEPKKSTGGGGGGGAYAAVSDDAAIAAYRLSLGLAPPSVGSAAAATPRPPPPTCNKVVVKTNYHDPDVKPPCSGGPGCANQSDCCALCANEPKCAVAVWSKPDASCTLKLSADQPYPCEKHAGLSGGAPPPHAVELVFDIEADPNENVDLSQDPAHNATLAQLRVYLAQQVLRMQPALYNVCNDDMDANPAVQNGAWVAWGCPKAESPLCGV